MRLRAVRIENFRGIEFFEITDLRDLVVIAGPNGCGKTAVLDGIRLLKSFYGGYSLNEWQMWFGEFQIDTTRPEGMLRLFRDRERNLRINAELELSSTDLSYLQEHAEDALRAIVWQARLGRNFGRWRQAVSVAEMNQYGEEVEREVQEGSAEVRQALGAESHHAGLTISPTGQIDVMEEVVLELLFQTYSPHELGVIDYHSSSRVYEREALGAVNLNLDQVTQQRRQQSLYNWREKYRNVKTELFYSRCLRSGSRWSEAWLVVSRRGGQHAVIFFRLFGAGQVAGAGRLAAQWCQRARAWRRLRHGWTSGCRRRGGRRPMRLLNSRGRGARRWRTAVAGQTDLGDDWLAGLDDEGRGAGALDGGEVVGQQMLLKVGLTDGRLAERRRERLAKRRGGWRRRSADRIKTVRELGEGGWARARRETALREDLGLAAGPSRGCPSRLVSCIDGPTVAGDGDERGHGRGKSFRGVDRKKVMGSCSGPGSGGSVGNSAGPWCW